MPDFDINLNPILVNTNKQLPNLPSPSSATPDAYPDLSGGRTSGAEDPLFAIFGKGPKVDKMLPTATAQQLYENRRYATFDPNVVDVEDQKAYSQSNWDKATNGVLKGLNLAGTTIAGSFGMLYGTSKWAFGGKFSDIWDNEVMQGLDKWNNEVDQNYLPNYYTNVEKNANWYSTDNWLKANFLYDKLIKNSGFAVGAMVSGNIANAGLKGAGAILGALAAEGSALAESSQAFKILTPILRNTARAFSQGKNIEAAQILEKELSSIVDVERASSELAKIAKTTNQFSNFGDTAKRTLIAGYSSAGESGFEALNTGNEFKRNLIEKYKESHDGQEPTGEELKTINDLTASVGKTSFFANLAILSLTEYTQLPKLLGSSYSAEKQAANSLLGTTEDVLLKDGKYIAKESTKVGKVLDKSLNVGKYLFDPKEGAQEGIQQIIQVGTQNYYSKAYKGQKASAWVDGFLYGLNGENEKGEGVGAINSKEGWESILLGGLTGGPMQARSNYIQNKVKASNTTEFLNLLNTTPSFKEAFKERLDSVNRATVLQEEQQQATIAGNKLEAKDLNTDMMHNYLSTRIKYGRYDMIAADLQELKQTASTEAGLASLKEQGIANINDTVQSYQARVNTLESYSKNLNELTKYVSLTYGGQTVKNSEGQLVKKYNSAHLDKMVYAASKMADYDVRIPQVSEVLLGKGIDVQSIVDDELTNDSPTKLQEELNKINALEDINKDTLKQNLQDVIELSKRRKQFFNEYEDIKKNPSKYAEVEEVKAPVDEKGAPLTEVEISRTKEGIPKKLKIGENYVAGSENLKTVEGVSIPQFLKFTVLGEDANGNVQIKTKDGKIHTLKPETFEKYKISLLSGLSREARFYAENVDKIFTYQKRNKEKVEGTIIYNKATKQLELHSLEKKKNGSPRFIIPINSLEQFKAKAGFQVAQIYQSGELTKTTEDILNETSPLNEKLLARHKILGALYDSTKEKLEKTLENITKANDTLKQCEEDIKNAGITKTGRARKSINAVNKIIKTATRLQEKTNEELDRLAIQKEELENVLDYTEDAILNISELPESGDELLQNLKKDISSLKEMISHTDDAIKQSKSLIDTIQNVLDSALKTLKQFISKINTQNTPLNLDSYREQLEKYFTEDIANQIISNKEGFTNTILELQEEIALYSEEIGLPDIQDKLSKLQENLQELQKGLSELTKEYVAKQTILKAFEEYAQREKEAKIAREKLLKNKAIQAEYLGVNAQGMSSVEPKIDDSYEVEAKKANPTSSTIPSGFKQTPYALRAERFGQRFHTLENNEEFRGQIVNVNTEKLLGLDGLCESILINEDGTAAKISPTEVVALVIVNKEGKPVDEFGEVITEDSLNKAIYQVFPSEALSQNYINAQGKTERQSMFRNTVSEEQKKLLTENYAQWRAQQKAATTLPALEKISASFGSLVIDENKEIHPVAETKLIPNEESLEDGSGYEVVVATTNESISNGQTTFNKVLGYTFLKVPGGLIKLFNKQLGASRATQVYNALLQIAKNVEKGMSVKDTPNKFIYDYLRSAVHWGIPKDKAGYNSVWYQSVPTEDGGETSHLFLSGNGANFQFDSASLEMNKENIISILSGMYHNGNAKFANGSKSAQYLEIVGFNTDGSPITKSWKNYQTYLLSSKDRKSEDIPFGSMAAIPTETAPNRKGIYFTLTTLAEEQANLKPVAKAQPKNKPTATPAPSPGTINLKGQPNSYVSPEGVEFTWIYNPNKEGVSAISILTTDTLGENLKKVIAAVKKQKPSLSDAEADAVAKTIIKQKIYNSIPKSMFQEDEDSFIIPDDIDEEAPFDDDEEDFVVGEEDETPTAPVSTDAKADNIISNGDRIINVQTKSVTDEITDTNGELFITSDKDPGGRIYINMDPLNDILVVPNNTLTVIDKKTGKEIINKELNPEGAVVFEAMQGRLFVVANINGQLIPFYKSSAGTSGKTQGEWYPFFGYTGAWLVKGGIDKATGKMNYSPEIDKVTTLLNENLVFPDKYIDRTTNTIKGNDGVVIMDMNKAFKVNRLWQKEFGSQTGKGTNYEIKGLKENTRSESGLVALITGLNTTELDSAKTPKENSEWFNLISKNAELAALESQVNGAENLTNKKEKLQTSSAEDLIAKYTDPNKDNSALREAVANIPITETENWAKAEEWLKKNFPNIPIFRVKNVINATNGRQAWGFFRDGAVYVYENAEIGTIYHEAFHAIFRMFNSGKEKTTIFNEFKARTGSYEDRVTGEKIEYAKATNKQIEEKLAEEFRDYVLNKTIPVKSKTNSIVKFFMDLVNFVKSFFIGPKSQYNTNQLFDRIGNGYYAKYNPFETSLQQIQDIETAFADDNAVLSEIPLVPYATTHAILQEMTFSLLQDTIYNGEKNIFKLSEQKLNAKDYYEKLKTQVQKSIINNKYHPLSNVDKKGAAAYLDLAQKIENNWEYFVEKHKDQLKSYNISFDENDNFDFDEYEKSKDDAYIDARKIDGFRKSNPAIKLLFGSLAKIDAKLSQKGQFVIQQSQIGGAILMPMDKVYITLKSALYSSIDTIDMLDRLRQIAIQDPSFEALYQRITKSPSNQDIDYSALTQPSQWNIITALWRSMKGSNPEVFTVFQLANGEIEIGDASLASAAKSYREDFGFKVFKSLKSNKTLMEYKDKLYKPTNVLVNYKLDAGKLSTYVKFLSDLGIEINAGKLNNASDATKAQFKKAVEGLKLNIVRATKEGVKFLGKESFKQSNSSIEGDLLKLGLTVADMESTEFETTYFNLSGDRTQSFIGSNIISNLHDFIGKFNNLAKLSSSSFNYLITDNFAKGSVVLNKIFTSDGKKRNTEEAKSILKFSYINGIQNQQTGRDKESSKLNYRERLIMEWNSNKNGVYLTLVPGDASIEGSVILHSKDNPFVSIGDITANTDTISDIFKGYFMAEMNVSREDRNIVSTGDRQSTDLRFFKDILGSELHDKLVNNTKDSVEKIYNDNKSAINRAVNKFIEEQTKASKELLQEFAIVSPTEDGKYDLSKLGVADAFNVSEQTLNDYVKQRTANYIIANIELHKLVYSDPYFYKDELKRIKNMGSPAQDLMTFTGNNASIAMSSLSKAYNTGYDTDDIGYDEDFTNPNFTTAVADDVEAYDEVLKNYDKPYTETDGGGMMTMKMNRRMRILASNWNEDEEKQYRYDVVYEKFVTGIELNSMEKNLFPVDNLQDLLALNPKVQSAYTIQKPIARGNKNDGNSYNDILLDKFSLVPLSFRVLHQLNAGTKSSPSNLMRVLEKMTKENVDYVVYESGRKVGTDKTTNLYNQEGTITSEPFSINNIPVSTLFIQSDVPSKDHNDVTQGSQITKLATMNLMEAGVPIDFMPEEKSFEKRMASWLKLDDKASYTGYKEGTNLYKELQNNQELLEALLQEGFETLLQKTGIIKTQEGFVVSDVKKLADTLKTEILKREANANMLEALKSLENGDRLLEATPAYQQIRNILYSIANNNVIKRKITGGQKVQMPSSFLERNRDITKTKDSKGKTVYQSNILNFYRDEEGKRVCEVMVGRWFKSSLSDSELLDYLNNTKEGQALLGVAFRIPTQNTNSIEVFKIAKFLPEGFEDTVVVPSALVAKAGSDFDIDKLFMYFKNLFVGKDGKPRLIELTDIDTTDEKQLTSFYEEHILGRYRRMQDLEKQAGTEKNAQTFLEQIFNEENLENEEDAINKIKYVPSLEEFIAENKGKDVKQLNKEWNKNAYSKILQNQYIESLQNIVANPLNFSNLIKQNDAQPLKDLAKDIVEKTKQTSFESNKTSSLLSWAFMSQLRQAFVTGKYAIGIAATAQTNHAQNQRAIITIDKSRLDSKKISEDDKAWLGDANVNFEQYNSIDGKPTFSFIKNKAGEMISDIIGMFIDGYVDISKGPWIMQLGASPNVAGPWLSLIKLGVPVKTVAYFMNQPIIGDLLRSLQQDGYSYLFNSTYVNDVKENYTNTSKADYGVIKQSELANTLGKKLKEMSQDEKAYQQFILDEFLKYAKMAEHLFYVQQGSNVDTANLNDGFLVFQKNMQLEIAKNNTIISSVEDIMDKSFIGKTHSTMNDVRDVLSEFLISDKNTNKSGSTTTRQVLEATLMPYIGLPARDFVAVARKAVNALFDWAVRTQPNSINNSLKAALVGKESYVNQTMEFISSIKNNPEHPLYNNAVINSISLVGNDKSDIENLQIKGKDNKIFDQNSLIYGFREIKEFARSINKISLYGNIIRIGILQSGLENSKISFTSLVPYEDFQEIYKETLSNLENMPNLADFYNGGILERSQWNNIDIVGAKVSTLKKNKFDKWYTDYGMSQDSIPESVKDKIAKKEIPPVLEIPMLSREARKDFIKYTWEDPNIKAAQKAEMRKQGDFSYRHTILLKKVYMAPGEPLINYGKKGNFPKYVYKAVHALGDSFRATEALPVSYGTFNGTQAAPTRGNAIMQASVLDNGFDKDFTETTDDVITNAYLGDYSQENNVPLPSMQQTQPSTNVKGFQGYKGGFENTGKGTPQGDGKDKAMRKVANSAIVELADNKESSSKTSLGEVGLAKEGDRVIMLARNGSLSGRALRAETKEQIREANLDGAEFIVGDMPNVDSQFIDYLQEIGAKFTIYHTGTTPRIQIATQPSTSVDNTKTPIEGLNERLDSYGNAKLVLSNDFNQGARPVGRLNSFKSSIAQVADNLQILADLNLNEFNFLTENDKKKLDALRPLAKEFIKINVNDISSAERRTVAVEKRYAQLSNELINGFVDIIGKHVEQQLGKTISSSQPTQAVSEQSNVDKKIKPEGLPEIKQQNKNNCR